MAEEKLDLKYGATAEERKYVKESLKEADGLKMLYEKELTNLKTKILRSFHTDNYTNFEKNKLFDTEKTKMNAIIDADVTMKAKYEAALAPRKGRPGFSEGILLLQTIAVKCVEKLANGEDVETKLTGWTSDDMKFKSASLDGVLGPNTFYVLASIAKEKGIEFDGIVDTNLLNAMINICGEEQPVTKEEDKTPVINSLAEKPTGYTPSKEEITDAKINIVREKNMDYATKTLEEGIPETEKLLFEKKDTKNRSEERAITIMALSFGYDELFAKYTREEKSKKLEEIKKTRDGFTKDGYEYRYYDAIINSQTEKMEKEVMDALEKYTLDITDTKTSGKVTGYSIQQENGKNKVTVMDPPGPDGTKYLLMVINGQRSPIPELKGKMIDKSIFELRIKEDGKTLAQTTYTSSQEGEEGNTYEAKDATDTTIAMNKTGTSDTEPTASN